MCPPPGPSLGEVALPFSLAVFATTSALSLLRTDWVRGEPTGLCGACAYDLKGLADDACCPECGSMLRGFTRPGRRMHLNTDRVPAWLFGVGVVLVAAYLGLALPEEVLVHIYRAEGFSEATARHVIPIRELRNGPLPLLGPLWLACGFVPLFCLIRSRAWSCLAPLLLLAAALALSLAGVAAP